MSINVASKNCRGSFDVTQKKKKTLWQIVQRIMHAYCLLTNEQRAYSQGILSLQILTTNVTESNCIRPVLQNFIQKTRQNLNELEANFR